eukprot:gb/GFBE01060818.1/.p1 GENE.gb/GFBE01060818.1/~~gb/GFBE01060818.1/.p1  ORF type:complete len:411 (+),score=67.94 gb/GFBE01060818.1/:1-1233(+)
MMQAHEDINPDPEDIMPSILDASYYSQSPAPSATARVAASPGPVKASARRGADMPGRAKLVGRRPQPSKPGSLGAPAPLGAYGRLLAQLLSGLQLSVAEQVVQLADELRDRQAEALAERQAARTTGDQRVALEDAKPRVKEATLRVLRDCETYSPSEAEAVVRRRVGNHSIHCLHIYGGLFHVMFYPFTIFLAVVAYVRVGSSASVWLFDSDSPLLGSALCTKLLRSFISLWIFIMTLLVALVFVVACAPADVVLLLLRPCLPTASRKAVTLWFFPSSLAFWSAGLCGFMPAVLAHRLLGATPLGEGVMFSLGRERWEAYEPQMGFRAAVFCDPGFMASPSYLRAAALKGVPQDFAPAYGGAACAAMPLAVQWAYLLGDVGLCAAWEAKTMEERQKAKLASLRGSPCSKV